MGIVIRQSIKSVVVTLAGVVLGALVTVLSTRFFPKTELGFTQNLIKIALQVAHFGLFGFNITLLIYGQKYPPGHKSRSTFLAISAVIPLTMSVLVSACYFLFRNHLGAIYNNSEDAAMMRQYLVLFPLLTIFGGAITWLEGYLQALHKTALQNFAREILARIIYITLIVLFAAGTITFDVFIWLYVLLYLIPFVFLLVVALRNPGFHFEFKKDAISFSEFKEIFRFSGYHMLTVVSSVLILTLDAILLAPLDRDGFEAVAVYSVATIAISMLRNPTRVIGVAVMPAFTQSYNEGDLKGLSRLFNRSAINMQIIGLALFALVYLNINNVQDLMGLIKGGYSQIKLLIMILMVGQLADMVSGLNFELIGVTKYYRFNFWIAIALLVLVVVLNFFLIKEMGIFGAAWATTIGLVFFNIAKTLFLWKKLHMQPFSRATSKVLLATGIAAVITWLIPYVINVYLDVIVRSFVFCMLLWIALYKTRVSPELNDITTNIIQKRRLY